jgi:hypothetical protein
LFGPGPPRWMNARMLPWVMFSFDCGTVIRSSLDGYSARQ